MTTTNKSRKIVLAAVAVGLVAMLGLSMAYRMENPSLTVSPRGGAGAMAQDDAAPAFPENMPPEMAKALEKSGRMPGQMPGGMPGGAPGGMGTGGMPPAGGMGSGGMGAGGMPGGAPSAGGMGAGGTGASNAMNDVMQRMQSDPKVLAAMQQLMQQLKENPNDAKALIGVAEQFTNMGAPERAESFLNRALVAEPSNTAALYMLGVTKFEAKDYLSARDRFSDVLALDPHHLEASFNLGIVNKYYLNKPDEAKALFATVRDAKDAPKDLHDMAVKELGTEPAKK
ncbi:MAG: tetratricopeptide repeat protein [Desulfovibrionaceae bacterium]